MADQDSAERPPGSGPPKPPPISGPPPMTATRSRLGTGRAAAPGGRPEQPAEAAQAGTAPSSSPAEPAQEQPPAAASAHPAGPEGVPAAEPASKRAGAEEQLAAEMGESAVEADADPARAMPPGRPAAEAGDGGPARPAARPPQPAGAPPRPAVPATPATRPASAAVAPARPAAAGDGAAAAASPTAERLAAAVRREPTTSGAPQAEKLVYVWPHLVAIEFISALLMLLSMIVLSWVVNAPLEAHANPDRTPNPSKAPWYFLNLQELLLHMHPGLAGVLVPAGALGAIAMIPYIDRDTRDVGKWFGTPNAVPITILVTIYTSIVEVALIFFDEYIGVKPLMTQLAAATGIGYLQEPTPFGIALFSVPNVIVPTALMLGPILPMMLIIWRLYKPNTREVMIALFTGFVVSYVILTIFGTFFRGQGMHLYWPWAPEMIRIE